MNIATEFLISLRKPEGKGFLPIWSFFSTKCTMNANVTTRNNQQSFHLFEKYTLAYEVETYTGIQGTHNYASFVVSLLDRSLHQCLNFISSVFKHRLTKRGHGNRLVKVGLTNITLKSIRKTPAIFTDRNGSSILKWSFNLQFKPLPGKKLIY
jgi:hypothetical protein